MRSAPALVQKQSVLSPRLSRAGLNKRSWRGQGRWRGSSAHRMRSRRASGALTAQARQAKPLRLGGREGQGSTGRRGAAGMAATGPRLGIQDAASGCTQHAPSGRRGPTWVPAVLPEHVGLHAVLGGEEPVTAGHRTPALRGSHILQVLLGVDVEAAPRREPGTAPWGERTAA